ncbi:MAG: RNA chaperone Hfq [Nitrospirota bacterium]
METNLLDKMLNLYHSQKTPVTIVLQNKNRITGRIGTFDSYVIIMESVKREIVYRHAISSVLPGITEARPQPEAQKPALPKAVQKPAPKPARELRQAKSKPPRQEPKAAPVSDPGLNTGMKEGLLRWMQEQKAGK